MKYLIATATLFMTKISLAMAGPEDSFPQPSESGLPTLRNSFTEGPGDVFKLVDAITNWVFAALIAIAVICILLAAWEYMSSGSEGVERAHKMLLYAAIGIVVAVLAKGIVFSVRKLTDSSTRTTNPVTTPTNR
jgi:hypothetical protein